MMLYDNQGQRILTKHIRFVILLVMALCLCAYLLISSVQHNNQVLSQPYVWVDRLKELVNTGNRRRIHADKLADKTQFHSENRTSIHAHKLADKTQILTENRTSIHAEKLADKMKFHNFSAQVTNHMIDTLTARVPPFLPDYRNPCWWESLPTQNKLDKLYANNFYAWHVKEKRGVLPMLRRTLAIFKDSDATLRLRCLPYFYLIGFPKCGSTGLFKDIGLHPQVALVSLKEPMFWNRRRFGRESNTFEILEKKAPFSDYLDLHDAAAIQIAKSPKAGLYPSVVGDGTPSYVWEFNAWQNATGNDDLSEPTYIVPHYIKHFTPNAKFVVILRQPVDRMFSDYLFVNKFKRSVHNFHKGAVESIQQMKACLTTRSERSCFYDQNLNIKMPLRLRVSHYYVFLRDWLALFPRDQFCITTLDEYSANKAVVISQISSFLGLSDLPDKEKNSLSKSKTKALSRRTSDRALGDMWNITRTLLRNYFRPWNRKLAGLLHDDKYLWNHKS